MASQEKVRLRSREDEVFEVGKEVAQMFEVLEDVQIDGAMNLDVSSRALAKVIEYCKKHAKANKAEGSEAEEDEEELKAWDADFVKMENSDLFALIEAANLLQIKSLLDLTYQTVNDMIKGKTPAEIRRLFNLRNDFSQEEEEEFRRGNKWAFE